MMKKTAFKICPVRVAVNGDPSEISLRTLMNGQNSQYGLAFVLYPTKFCIVREGRNYRVSVHIVQAPSPLVCIMCG